MTDLHGSDSESSVVLCEFFELDVVCGDGHTCPRVHQGLQQRLRDRHT